jgi:hypothetical protein
MPPTRPRGRQFDVLLALVAAGGDMPYRDFAERFTKPTRDACLRAGWVITRRPPGGDIVRVTTIGRLAAQAASADGYADAVAAAADPATRRAAAARVGEQLAAFDVRVFGGKA